MTLLRYHSTAVIMQKIGHFSNLTTMNHTNFKIRLALFYGAMFLVIGLYMPFFPVWLEGRGMNKSEITAIIAAPLFARLLFTPLLGFMTDQSGNRRRALILLLWCSLLFCFLLSFAYNFYILFAVVTLFGIFWTTVMPVTEAIAMLQVREKGMNYGHVRLWGSLTFIIASLVGGWLIDIKGSESLWYALMAAVLITLLLSYSLPKEAEAPQTHALETAAALPPISKKSLWVLMKNPIFILFLFAGGLGQASHAFYYALGTLHWHALGYSGLTIGLLWSIGVLAEVILFVFAVKWFEKIRADKLLLWGSLLTIIRWVITAFDPPLWLLFSIQTFHAFSFAMIHLGAVYFISHAVPERLAATAQGIYGAFAMGSLLGILTLISGPLYENYAAFGYFSMAIASAIAAILSWILIKSWDGATLKI